MPCGGGLHWESEEHRHTGIPNNQDPENDQMDTPNVYIKMEGECPKDGQSLEVIVHDGPLSSYQWRLMEQKKVPVDWLDVKCFNCGQQMYQKFTTIFDERGVVIGRWLHHPQPVPYIPHIEKKGHHAWN